MIERADILSLLKRESESLPYAAILRALGGRPANRELKRLLEGLVRDGEVVRSRGNRYTLAGASTTGTITGTLSLHRDGYGFVRVGDGGEDVFVPAKAIGSAMHGDTVTVKAERSRYQGQQRREGRITTIVTRAHASMVGGSSSPAVAPCLSQRTNGLQHRLSSPQDLCRQQSMASRSW